MKVYVLTLDGYVQGVFRNLSVLYRAVNDPLNPVGVLTGTDDCKCKTWSKWGLQQAFRETNSGYVTLVAEGNVYYEITRKELICSK